MTIVLQHRFWDLKVEKDLVQRRPVAGGDASTLQALRWVTDFGRQSNWPKFQANGADDMHESAEAESDAPQPEASDDGSNVVNVDFTRKK